MIKAKCTVLIGVPASGKNYWIDKERRFGRCINVISCDDIRESLSNNGKYVFDRKKEDIVWDWFYTFLSKVDYDIVINNTNCKISYINKIKSTLNKDVSWTFEYVWFDCPMWKIYLRNILRKIFRDKWIPIDILKNMQKNYKKLKKEWKN